MGERFKESAKQDIRRDTPFEQRFDGRGRFYGEVVELVRRYPVLGVGLDRFRYYDQYGYAAHSDYVALIGETGVPGFTLYFSAYAIVLARLRKAIRTSRSREAVFRCHLFRSSLIAVLLVALGRWNYNHIPTYVLLAMVGRYAAEAANIEARPLI
jgi:O-antigen ligase